MLHRSLISTTALAAVLALATGLCSALLAIHRAGVVHGDLSPDTVLLLADGPRVTGFGRPGSPAGDVYNLGAVLYFAVVVAIVFVVATVVVNRRDA